MSLNWSIPIWSVPLLLLLAAGALLWTVWAYQQTRPAPGPRLRAFLAAMRSVVLFLLLLAIAGPVLTRLVIRQEPAELLFVLEDSGSMAIEDCPAAAPADSNLTSRWLQGLAIAEDLTRFVEAGSPRVEISHFRGTGLQPLTEFSPAGSPGPAPPVGHGTDLGRLLGQVRSRLVGRPARAIVLISDGQETSGRQESRSAGGFDSALDLMTNLYVVGVGDPQGPPDRVLVDLRYPDFAFRGDEIVIEAGVLHRYVGAGDLTAARVTLKTPDGRLVAEATAAPGQELANLELAFRAETAGPLVLDLEVSPLDNERFLANNRASLVLNIRQERERVLLLAGRPDWDVRFLAQAAARESRVDLATVYEADRGLVFADSLKEWSEPTTTGQWLDWDAVVLTGWEGSLDLDWQLLAGAVQEGLGLVILPGRQVVEDGGRGPAAPGPGLQDLLPVQAASWRWLSGSFFLEPAGDSPRHPLLAGLDQGQAGAAGAITLGDLPPLRKVAAVQARTQALTLLTAAAEEHRESGQWPVLVVENRGQGRLAWVGGRRFWELAFWDLAGRASTDPDDREHVGRLLLRNLLVWAASGEDDAGLSLVGGRTIYQEGEPIKLVARWRDLRGQAVTDRDLTLKLKPTGSGQDSTAVRSFAMQPEAGNAGVAQVTLPPLPPGAYLVELVGEGDPPVQGRSATLFVTGHSIEMTQVRLDERRLTQLANRAGGSYFRARDLEQLAELRQRLQAVDWTGQEHPVRARQHLLAGWPFFALVVALLSLEWFLRRRHNLL